MYDVNVGGPVGGGGGFFYMSSNLRVLCVLFLFYSK